MRQAGLCIAALDGERPVTPRARFLAIGIMVVPSSIHLLAATNGAAEDDKSHR